MSFSSSQEFNIELGGVGVSADQMAHAFVLTCENNSVNSRFNRLHFSKGNNFRFFVFNLPQGKHMSSGSRVPKINAT